MNIQQNSVSENNFEQCIKCTICTVYLPGGCGESGLPGSETGGSGR